MLGVPELVWNEVIINYRYLEIKKKIKAKNKKKAITNANFLKNKTSSKRRKEAEEGYIDCKTQAKILMKSQKKTE